MNIRYNVNQNRSWYWDSRNDCWVIKEDTSQPQLQYYSSMTNVWTNVPTNFNITGPGPQPKD